MRRIEVLLPADDLAHQLDDAPQVRGTYRAAEGGAQRHRRELGVRAVANDLARVELALQHAQRQHAHRQAARHEPRDDRRAVARAELARGQRIGGRAPRFGDRVDRRARRQAHDVDADEILGTDRLLRQALRRRADPGDRHRGDRLEHRRVEARLAREDGDVDDIGDDIVIQQVAVLDRELDADRVELRFDARDDFRQAGHRDHLGRAQAQYAVQWRDAAEARRQLVEQADRFAGVADRDQSFGRGLGAATAAIEQRHTQRGFEFLDAQRDRRLGHVEPVRGLLERAAARDGKQGVDLSHRHAPHRHLSPSNCQTSGIPMLTRQERQFDRGVS